MKNIERIVFAIFIIILTLATVRFLPYKPKYKLLGIDGSVTNKPQIITNNIVKYIKEEKPITNTVYVTTGRVIKTNAVKTNIRVDALSNTNTDIINYIDNEKFVDIKTYITNETIVFKEVETEKRTDIVNTTTETSGIYIGGGWTGDAIAGAVSMSLGDNAIVTVFVGMTPDNAVKIGGVFTMKLP
jgi:hypothetical protein